MLKSASNRTIQELKFSSFDLIFLVNLTSNRTIQELKSDLNKDQLMQGLDFQSYHTGIEIFDAVVAYGDRQLLPIVPYRNWNILKNKLCKQIYFLPIVPYRNWNDITNLPEVNVSILPIVPYRNWNFEARQERVIYTDFQSYHTGIEIFLSNNDDLGDIPLPIVPYRNWNIKFTFNSVPVPALPIVPYRNWNQEGTAPVTYRAFASNRTIQELKFSCFWVKFDGEIASNRTIQELK